ncbi:MAG TPA: D-cysteine desulfhydrase family protein [Egibacteraceae bacterium]|nr:D-cysteine desulfhydrase family protein [Egibacteraceae bacterium]
MSGAVPATREPSAPEPSAGGAGALREALAVHPRVRLAALPTPLQRLDSLSAELGVELWVKRDDLTGVGLGGNKVRKLEYLLGDARRRVADVLVTVGGAQSNHARTVAAVAAMAGMDCHLVLGGHRPAQVTGNLLLDGLFGARAHFAGTEDWAVLEEQAGELAALLQRDGRRPYVMPIGGSTAVGALGFVDALAELAEQCAAVGLRPRHVVHATSSGGTQAGLEAGRALLGWEEMQISGVTVAKTSGELSATVAELMRQVTGLLGGAVTSGEPHLVGGYMGERYAAPTAGAHAAIVRLARHEGLLADPVYSGKALHATFDLLGAGRLAGPVVFWHTGGVPALFSDEQGLMGWDRHPALAAGEA